MDSHGDIYLQTASSCCEACGRAIPLQKSGVKLEGMVLSLNDNSVRLTYRESSMVELLLKHFGETVHRDRIWNVVWNNSDTVDHKIVDVIQCKVNAKLRPIGLRVRSVWGVGKVLDFVDPGVANVAKRVPVHYIPKQGESSHAV